MIRLLNEIRPGDSVRSYDFSFDNYNYIEGKVLKIAPWDNCHPSCETDHIHISVKRQFQDCNSCYSLDSRRRNICESCDGEGSIEIPPLNAMIYPHITHLDSRSSKNGLVVLGPGIIRLFSEVENTLNYPRGL
jgi:hypothetical protein